MMLELSFNWDVALQEMNHSVVCQWTDWWHLLGIPALLLIPIWLPYYLLMKRFMRRGEAAKRWLFLTRFACYATTLGTHYLMIEGVCNKDYLNWNRLIGDSPDLLASLSLCALFLALLNRLAKSSAAK